MFPMTHFLFLPSMVIISDETSPLWGLSVANHYLKASVHRKVESEGSRRQKFLSEEHEPHQAQFVG